MRVLRKGGLEGGGGGGWCDQGDVCCFVRFGFLRLDDVDKVRGRGGFYL